MQSRISAVGSSANLISSSSTSLLSNAVTTLADGQSRQIDSHLFDFLTIEMIQVIADSAAAVDDKNTLFLQDIRRNVDFDQPPPLPELEPGKKQVRERDALRKRLDDIGFRIGFSLVERLSRDKAPFNKVVQSGSSPEHPIPQLPVAYESLDLVKFLCKDVWFFLYGKQIDNLRTNHRGVFVLHDNAFKPLSRYSCASHIPGEKEAMALQISNYLHFPAGLVRGCLANLGLWTTVTPESGSGFACTFQVKTLS